MSGNHYYDEDADPMRVLDPFTRGYVAGLLFGESIPISEDEDEPDTKSPFDLWLTWEDFDEPSQASILRDCAAFRAANAADISAYGEADAGNDYYFTRQGHGAGFWEEDHGTPEICKRLDYFAKSAGEIWLCLSPDGKLVIS